MVDVRAEMSANVWQIRTEIGARVAADDELLVLESMKMEIPVTAPSAGTVVEIRVAPEDKVREGQVLVVLE
jgi:urea carboxylase